MKKRLNSAISILLSAVLLLALVPFSVSAASNEQMTLSASTKNAVPGQTVDIDISMKNNPGVSSVGLSVAYDSDILTIENIAFNPEIGGSTQASQYTRNPAKIIWINPTANYANDSVIATLTFRVNAAIQDNITTDVELSYDPDDIYDIDENNIECTLENGKVKVVASEPGDINGDGKVNNKDATRLMQYLSAWDVFVNEPCLDTNGDGKVNNKDATRLMQFLAGWDVELHVGSISVIACTHSLTKTEAVAPSCETAGNIDYWHCSKCGKYFADANAVREIKQADTVIEATGHTPEVIPAVPATYESVGYTEGSRCSVCGKVLHEPEPINPPQKDTYSIIYHLYNGDAYLQELGASINNPNLDYYTTQEGYIAPDGRNQLKDATVDGYRFEGWYDSEGSSGELVKTIPAGSKGNYDLYARWSLREYTIQFESDLIPVNSIKYTVDRGATLPIPRLDGYNFTGWSNGDGIILKTIPAGTVGNKVLKANWLSERNKAWTKNSIGEPIIIEDDETNTILFTYEIGRIENVPLYVIENFGYINSEGVSRTVSKEYSVKTDNTLMDQYATNVSNATTNSSQWSLSNGWNESVYVNNRYLTEEGLTETDATTLCKTDSSNWLVSNGTSGSTTTTTYDSSQDYDLNTATGNTKTYDTHDETNTKTKKQSAELSAKYEHKASILEKATPVGENNFSIEGKVGYEGSRTKSKVDKTGTETDAGNSDQTGNVKHTGTDTVSTGSWNSSSSYGGSKSVSESNTLSKTISKKISNETGYGKTYIKDSSESNSIGLSNSTSNSKSYSSSVAYSLEETEKKTVTYTTSNTKTGYHRLIKAGTAHVFAIVGYDIKTASYFTSTISIMDDEMHDFEDYSYSTSAYNDNQTGVISFEVPYEVEEYVLSRVGETDGLEFNSAGVVTGYNGSETTVIIPEYHAVSNRDGTKSVIKVTGIDSEAFKNNANITGVQLSDFISDIPSNAFENCTELKHVEMPSVVSIGAESFKNCTKLDTVYLSPIIESLGDNAFDNLDSFVVYTSKKDVINGAVNSGAKNIVIYISDSNEDINKQKITINDETETFILNGCGNTFNNLLIESNASFTVVNNIKLNSSAGTPLKISSPIVQLGKVELNSSGISLELNNDCILELYGESSVVSGTGNAVLCKNVELAKTEDAIKNGVYSEINVSKNLLVCGNIESNSLLKFDGRIITISEDDFAKYDKGQFVVTFNPQGGTASATENFVFYGSAYGELPTATRDYYTFDGWYTDPNEGNRITETSIFEQNEDISLYAHWTVKPTSNWVLASELPDGAQTVEEKWSYTQRSTTTSSSSTMEGWTPYNSTWVWSSYGNWSGWSRTQYSSSDSRKVESRTVTDQNAYTSYKYWIYRTPDGWGYGTQNWSGTSGHGACTVYDEININYELPVYNSSQGIYGPYNSSMFSHSGDSYWFSGGSTWHPAVTHTEWRYADRSKVYTYYFEKYDNLESNTEVTASDSISNIQKWVKYIEK